MVMEVILDRVRPGTVTSWFQVIQKTDLVLLEHGSQVSFSRRKTQMKKTSVFLRHITFNDYGNRQGSGSRVTLPVTVQISERDRGSEMCRKSLYNLFACGYEEKIYPKGVLIEMLNNVE